MSESLPAPSPTPLLSAVPAGEPEPRWVLVLLLAAALLPRLVLLPWSENLYGDSVVRTELAERWLREPHLITAYGDGAFQFGPLHLYLVGAALAVVRDRALAGGLVSLVFGVLTVVPLFSLSRRLFGWRAGVWACLAFSAWGLHVQFSTTAASEALALFLVVSVFSLVAEALDENRLGPLFGAAVVLNLACATRYDAWLFIPLISLALVFWGEDRVAALARAFTFGLVCLPFPLLWMQGNELMHGDPFFPIRAVEQYHRDWSSQDLGRLGPVLPRLRNLFFWPAMALITLSPVVAWLGAVGMRWAWKERPELRWLVLMALVPAAYFTFRSAVLGNFVPLGRFTAAQLVLLLPFLLSGYEVALGSRPAGVRRAVAGVGAALAVALPLVVGLLTFRADGRVPDALRPLSPVTTNPAPIMQAARFLEENAARTGGSAVVDEDANFLDLQLAFYSDLPEERLARVRWETFRKHFNELRPEYLVRFQGGKLERDPGAKLEGRLLTLDGVVYEQLEGFTAPVLVYRRRP